MFLINHVFVGTRGLSSAAKRALLRSLGHSIGRKSVIVSPITVFGSLEIGDNCWINRGFTVHGNGRVSIGSNCDIAPDVVFLTGGHKIGRCERRAGEGEKYVICVGDGCWIGARSTILRDTVIGKGSVVAACACVIGDVPENSLVGGVPSRVLRRLDE